MATKTKEKTAEKTKDEKKEKTRKRKKDEFAVMAVKTNECGDDVLHFVERGFENTRDAEEALNNRPRDFMKNSDLLIIRIRKRFSVKTKQVVDVEEIPTGLNQ